MGKLTRIETDSETDLIYEHNTITAIIININAADTTRLSLALPAAIEILLHLIFLFAMLWRSQLLADES